MYSKEDRDEPKDGETPGFEPYGKKL